MLDILSEVKEKQKKLIKYCLKYKNAGRINNAVKMIGWTLSHCNGDEDDARFAVLLLQILTGDI